MKEEVKNNSNINKNSNIKQILILIFFIIIITIGIYITNNYKDNENNGNEQLVNSYTLDTIPEYSSEAYITIKNNIPNFNNEDFTTSSFENYSDLDEYGRCGVAFANLNKEGTMPKEDESRKSLDKVIPSGWQDTEYPEINVDNLYNKCHLIAYSLSAENTNDKNIITGTRYFNISGMTPFENQVRKYLNDNPDKHVLYRVTPIYEEENLVASGVTIEAESVEDKGASICFYVYIYNVQPGVIINYETGESKLAE